MRNRLLPLYIPTLILTLLAPNIFAQKINPDYAVVVSEATRKNTEWAPVVEELLRKHSGRQVIYREAPVEALGALQTLHPRYTCFVARPEEASRHFVGQVLELTRQYDSDPYADTLWGILTGYDASNALNIVKTQAPLVVRKVASGTDVALEMCEEGIWYCELVKNRMVKKERGGKPREGKGPDDTTEALVAALNDYRADLFVTSGHATERNWSIGFRYKNGSFTSKAGQLSGRDTNGRRVEIDSKNPKVYLPIGNCLMGHIDGPDAMALAWMNDAGVRQMIGYTVPTWYGYAGWGCLDYFLEQPGRYTFAEAYHANQRALQHLLVTCFPQHAKAEAAPGKRRAHTGSLTEAAKAAGLRLSDATGLLFDRDVVAFYGDPKWEARMAEGEKAWEQALAKEDGVYTFTITPQRGKATFDPVNTNGSQRGGRPIIHFFERRLRDIEILEGQDLQPLIADDFLLIPNPRDYDPNRTYRLKFRAKPLLR